MLNDLSEQIRECLLHAEGCAQQAAVLTDLQLKQDFLDALVIFGAELRVY